jgi:hypothetical protein
MFATKHSPHGEGSKHLDNGRLEEVIARYQTHGDAGSLSEIVRLTQDRALTLIRYHKTARYRPEAELLSDINFKLLRAVDKFDPAKGTAFTFVSCLIQNSLCTSVSNARRSANTYKPLNKAVLSVLADTSNEDRLVADDLSHRIKAGARTTLTEPLELAAQRWYIASFLADGFDSCRHECANAAMGAYSLSHERSRELYDLTMLEVRRILYDDVKRRPQIIPGQLNGTRCAWMTRYAPLLSPAEFTKFVILVRNLGPFVVMLIDPESRSRRQDRNPAIGRKNLEWVLNGHPDAAPLFKCG